MKKVSRKVISRKTKSNSNLKKGDVTWVYEMLGWKKDEK